MITVDNRQGRVAKVTSRYVVLRALDGIEAIVPNETLVTDDGAQPLARVARHPRRDAGAHRLRRRRRACASRSCRTLPGPNTRLVTTPEPPAAFVNALGENGIDLELVLWVSGPQVGSADACERRESPDPWSPLRPKALRLSPPAAIFE